MTGRYEEKKKTKMRKGKIGLSDLSDLQMANKIRNWFFFAPYRYNSDAGRSLTQDIDYMITYQCLNINDETTRRTISI